MRIELKEKRDSNDREGLLIGHGVASVGAAAKQEGFAIDLIDMRHVS